MRRLIAIILLVVVGMALRRAIAAGECSDDEGPIPVTLLSLASTTMGVLASLRELV